LIQRMTADERERLLAQRGSDPANGPIDNSCDLLLPIASESPDFQLLPMLSADESGDPIQHIPNASG
jgi:hypothetical protein